MKRFRAPLWSGLAFAASLLLLAGTATASTITVPNGAGGGTCGPGNPNNIAFSGNCGALVSITDTNPAYVQDNSPSAEGSYRVRFYANPRRVDPSGELEIFAAYSGTEPSAGTPPPANSSRIRVTLGPSVSGVPRTYPLRVYARLNTTSEAFAGPFSIAEGWRSIELAWTGGTSGTLSIWVDGHSKSGLSGINTATGGIDYVRWGALNGLSMGTPPDGVSHDLWIDDFVSQRSGYIGAVTPLFNDVAVSAWYHWWIQGIRQYELTAGCGNGAFCPNSTLNRAEIAVWQVRGLHGILAPVPPSTGTVFSDVPFGQWYTPWVEQAYADGTVQPCGSGMYCPMQAIQRGEMASWLLKARFGSTYTPPAATGTVFADVPLSHPYAAWIEDLFNRGITAGCDLGPPRRYCPDENILRSEFSVFLTNTYNIPMPQAGP